MGIRNSQKATIPIWSLGDLGLMPMEPAVSYIDFMERPQQEVHTEMITGQTPQEIADALVEKILAEKII